MDRRGGLEESEVEYELIFRPYLQVIAGLCLAVVHGVLLHPHKCGVRGSLGIRVTVAKYTQLLIILAKLVGMFPQLLYLLAATLRSSFCSLVSGAGPFSRLRFSSSTMSFSSAGVKL